jgi:hypothetical protein
MEKPGGQDRTRPANASEAMNQDASALVELRIDEGNDSREIRRWSKLWGLNKQISKPQVLCIGLKRAVKERDDAADTLSAEKRRDGR